MKMNSILIFSLFFSNVKRKKKPLKVGELHEKKRVGHLVRECGVEGVNSVTETLNRRMDHLEFVMQKPVPLLPREVYYGTVTLEDTLTKTR